MSTVNLLPREQRDRQRIRRQTFTAGFAAAAIVALVLGFWFLQVMRLGDVERDLDAQRAENAGLETQINQLTQFQDILDQLEAKRGLLRGILENEVSWSGVLRDISLMIPREVWLTDMTGAVTAATGSVPLEGEAQAPASPLIGSIQFNGTALDTPDVALWLTRLEGVRGWANAWLSAAQKTRIGGTEVVNFSTSVDLTTDAAVRRRGGQS